MHKILFSPESLLWFALLLLSLLASPCINKLFLCSLVARPDPGGLWAPEKQEEENKCC